MKLRLILAASSLMLPLACSAQTTSPAPAGAPAAPTAAVANDGTPAASTEPAAAPPPKAAAPTGPKHTYSQCNVDGPYIAMTFDDGPHAAFTPRLLDMLKERNLKATFFVVGKNVVEYPQIMKRIVNEGHEIANHSWSHPLLSNLGEGGVTEQLQKTHDAIERSTGVAPKTMRPPYGGFTANQRAWAHRKWGYKTILWDVDPLDWKYRNASRVHEEIVRRTVPGSIVLAHDIHKTTVDAMPKTFDDLTAKGFKFVTVSELLAMDRPPAPKPKAAPAVEPAGVHPESPVKSGVTSAAPASPVNAPAPPARKQRAAAQEARQ